MANSLSSLSVEQLKKAVQIKEEITRLEAELTNLLSGRGTSSPASRGGMSAAGRAKIAAAQRARWARVKGAATSAGTKPGPRKMSAAARAKIAAAARARWAKVKAGK